jgi:phosphatidylserine/phosphatidylglycerophosphate/cardiolipin synthase-like enzyme
MHAALTRSGWLEVLKCKTWVAAVVAAFLLIGAPAHATSAEVAFSPNRGAMDLVIRTIASAKSNIRIAAYGFTSKPIALALLQAHKRGVDLRSC